MFPWIVLLAFLFKAWASHPLNEQCEGDSLAYLQHRKACTNMGPLCCQTGSCINRPFNLDSDCFESDVCCYGQESCSDSRFSNVRSWSCRGEACLRAASLTEIAGNLACVGDNACFAPESNMFYTFSFQSDVPHCVRCESREGQNACIYRPMSFANSSVAMKCSGSGACRDSIINLSRNACLDLICENGACSGLQVITEPGSECYCPDVELGTGPACPSSCNRDNPCGATPCEDKVACCDADNPDDESADLNPAGSGFCRSYRHLADLDSEAQGHCRCAIRQCRRLYGKSVAAKPIQENPGHHSLSSRAILWGRTLQCAYQPDQKLTRLGPRQDRVRWPEWKYDATLGHAPNWHSKLLKVPQEHQARSSKVFDVETLVLLLPNILDIDIFMALASTRSVHRQIFNSLAIKAAVHCLWMELVSPVFCLTLLFNLMDLLMFAAWGLTPAGRPLLWRLTRTNKEAEANSSLQFPRFANFVLAGLLRDLTNIGWWLFSLCRKWLRHKKNLTIDGTLGRGHELRSGLHSLWHPTKIFDLSHNTNMPELILCLLKAIFLFSVQCMNNCEKEMPDTTQALLAVCFFMHSVKLIYMLRVSAFGGKKILVLLKTLVSGAMREMFLVAFLFFLAFVITAVMLDRKGALTVVSWSLYRGLIFGDGAGLDNMGFAIEGSWRGESGFVDDIDVLQQLLTIMAILGTVTFIVILNMIIAIYSNEYGRLEMESDLLFQRERAKYCCNCLLGMQKLRSRNCCLRFLTFAAVFLCSGGALSIFIFFPSGGDGTAGTAGTTATPLAAFLLAGAEVGMQALMMRSEWFAVGRKGAEGPREEHFLWIVRRCEQRDLQLEQKHRRHEASVNAEVHAKLTELISDIRDQVPSRGAPSKGSCGTFVSKRNTEATERPQTRVPTGTTARNGGTPQKDQRQRQRLMHEMLAKGLDLGRVSL